MNITENEKKLILETLEEYYSPFLSMDTLCGEEWEYIDWSDFDRKFLSTFDYQFLKNHHNNLLKLNFVNVI